MLIRDISISNFHLERVKSVNGETFYYITNCEQKNLEKFEFLFYMMAVP